MSSRHSKFARLLECRQQGIVVLEDVADPHNAQAVLRTAEALGFQHIAFIFVNQPPFDPTRVGRMSSGSANRWLSFGTYTSTDACLDDLGRRGFTTVATVPNAPGIPSLYESRLDIARLALLFGNEHDGLSPQALERADRTLHIPTPGMTRSLNLSVAAAIVLAEVTRQRLARGIESFRLPADERAALLERWQSSQ